jgi:glycosyltransferase involved in cell wall biosynthesis
MPLTDYQRYILTVGRLVDGSFSREVSHDKPDIVIPAHNEQATVGDIVKACVKSEALGRVIVVASRCTDKTIAIAKANGADVVAECHFKGKGQAVTTGLNYVTSDRVIFMDADLINVRPKHIRMMARDTSGMTIWVVDNDQIPTIAQAGKGGSGTRSMPTSLARSTELVGYGMEKALNYSCVTQLIPLVYRDMPDICQSWVPYFVEHGTLPDWARAHCMKNHFNR